MIIDGNFNVKGCVCTGECEFPCWQRVGLDDTIGMPEYACCCAAAPSNCTCDPHAPSPYDSQDCPVHDTQTEGEK